MAEQITSGEQLEATPVGTVVRDALGRLGEVQNTGGHNSVAFVGEPGRIYWHTMVSVGGLLPLTVVVGGPTQTEVSILHPGGARNTTVPTGSHLVELTIESASAYVTRRNAREGNTALVQVREVTNWRDVVVTP